MHVQASSYMGISAPVDANLLSLTLQVTYIGCPSFDNLSIGPSKLPVRHLRPGVNLCLVVQGLRLVVRAWSLLFWSFRRPDEVAFRNNCHCSEALLLFSQWNHKPG